MVKVIFDVLDRKLHNMMKWGWVLWYLLYS